MNVQSPVEILHESSLDSDVNWTRWGQLKALLEKNGIRLWIEGADVTLSVVTGSGEEIIYHETFLATNSPLYIAVVKTLAENMERAVNEHC